MLTKIAFGLLLCNVVFAADDSYEGYKIYDANAKDTKEKEVLYRLYDSEKYDFIYLPKIVGKSARVIVSPEDQLQFETALKKYGVNFTVVNENLGRTIELEREQNNRLRSVWKPSSLISFSVFQTYEGIMKYLDDLNYLYSHRVSVRTLGKSYEKNNMQGILITNGDGRRNKNMILIDAGIHAREWIAPATALYVIHQLVENFYSNADLLKNYNWLILPLVNPDGYKYTHTTYRMWRKTRSPSDFGCFGVDGNRNFDYHWGEIGTSSYPCSEIYKGEFAFSEPETQVIRRAMHAFGNRIKMYISLHSYGSLLLYPWSYTKELPDNWEEIQDVAQAGADAIKKDTGREYTVGSTTAILYGSAGASDDYALGAANIPIAITMELPAGGSGFDPEPSQIKPFVSEAWTGIRAMAEKVIAKY